MDDPKKNTDRIVWDGLAEGQNARVIITGWGGIGIYVNGTARVLTAERWLKISKLYDAMASLFDVARDL
jgi:hypothetical protein